MTKPFTLEHYSNQFWRVTCPYCADIWQEKKTVPPPKQMRCRSCKYSAAVHIKE